MNEFIINCPNKLIKNWYELERLASKKDFKVSQEANLFLTKWPDYQLYHPVNSNIIFFEEYKWLYKEYYRRYEDFQEAIVKRGVKAEDLYKNPKHTIKAVIKGRIEADKIGIPYGLYISFANKILIKEHLWKHIPLVTHLYNSNLVEEIKEMWLNSCQYDFLKPSVNLFLEKQN